MKVLIIDDDVVYRMIASKMMKLMEPSIEIVECENGKIGLESLQKQHDLSKRIAILLDLNMPVLDGWGFLETIERSTFNKLNHLTIYIVTSSVDKNDILKASQYSFIESFFHKPLSKENIETVLTKNS